MNRNTHRLIYNSHRNSPMAVAESARSCGKGRQAAQGCRSKRRANRRNDLDNAGTNAADRGLEGKSVAIAAAVIDNRNGALRADGALTVDSGGTLDNAGGLVSAAETVVVRDRAATKTLAIANAGGTFVAGERLAIDAASLGGDGNLLSHGDLALALLADFTNTGEITANRNASVDTAGSLCIPPFCYGAPSSGSISASGSKVKSDYASVTEQSAIRAGDGGFDVKVNNDTDLKGGAITSTQQAIDDKLNRFETGGQLTTSDIENKAEYTAKSASINIGTGFSAAGALVPQGTSAGFGKDSDSASSTTQAAISGIAGNKEARTGDKETGIAKIFDQEKVQKEIEAQTKITQMFGQLAPKAAADFAEGRKGALNNQAKLENDPAKKAELQNEAKKWDDGGAYRVALHTALGGLAGGTSGALGAAAGASAAPLLNELQDGIAKSLKDAGASDGVAKVAGQLIAGTTAAGIGAAVGGSQGAMTAFNTDANNRQLHPDEKRILRERARAKADEIAAGRSEEDKQRFADRLYVLLEAETTALLDARENRENRGYRQQLAQTGVTPGLEGQFYAERELQMMDWAHGEALSLQREYAGQTIQLNGRDLIADGGKLQFFQSTDAQYRDSRLFDTAQREILLKQFAGNEDREAAIRQAQEAYRNGGSRSVDQYQNATLERMRTPNGSLATSTADLDLATLGVGGLVKKGGSEVVEAFGGYIERKALARAEAAAEARASAQASVQNNFYREGESYFAQTYQDLKSVAAQTRSQLAEAGIEPTAGNVGTAQINVFGKPGETVRASSRVGDDAATAREGFVSLPPEEQRILKPLQDPKDPIPRQSDTEYKILENFAQKNISSPNVQGSINLYTERAPCYSCTDVIRSQFTERFPNMEVRVYHSNGEITLYKGDQAQSLAVPSNNKENWPTIPAGQTGPANITLGR